MILIIAVVILINKNSRSSNNSVLVLKYLSTATWG